MFVTKTVNTLPDAVKEKGVNTLPDAVRQGGFDPADPVGSLSGRVQHTLFVPGDPAPSLTGRGGRSREPGVFRQAAGSDFDVYTVNPNPTQKYAVNKADPVLGIGRVLGYVGATNYQTAHQAAVGIYGDRIVVALAGGRSRRSRTRQGRP